MNFDDAAHRAEFDRLMAEHPHGAASAFEIENFYAAQVVWDETMADNAARWVAAHAPLRQLVILAGSAHCRQEAIPARIARRQPLRVASIRLGADDDQDRVGFDYALVFDGS